MLKGTTSFTNYIICNGTFYSISLKSVPLEFHIFNHTHSIKCENRHPREGNMLNTQCLWIDRLGVSGRLGKRWFSWMCRPQPETRSRNSASEVRALQQRRAQLRTLICAFKCLVRSWRFNQVYLELFISFSSSDCSKWHEMADLRDVFVHLWMLTWSAHSLQRGSENSQPNRKTTAGLQSTTRPFNCE